MLDRKEEVVLTVKKLICLYLRISRKGMQYVLLCTFVKGKIKCRKTTDLLAEEFEYRVGLSQSNNLDLLQMQYQLLRRSQKPDRRRQIY